MTDCFAVNVHDKIMVDIFFYMKKKGGSVLLSEGRQYYRHRTYASGMSFANVAGLR